MGKKNKKKTRVVVEVVSGKGKKLHNTGAVFHEQRAKTVFPVTGSAALANTIGSQIPKVGAFARSVADEVRTHEDVFRASLLCHLMDRQLEYPLPPFYNPGFNNQSTGWSDTLGYVAPQAATMAGTSDFQQTNPALQAIAPQPIMEGAVTVARYGVFKGKVITELSSTTNGSGDLEMWLWFDPSDYSYPLKGFNMNDPTNPSVEVMKPWTALPFVPGTSFVPTIYTRKTQVVKEEVDYDILGAAPAAVPGQLEADTSNLYYQGGVGMTVQHTNRDAFTTVAMRARNYSNVVHRFFDSLDNMYTNTNLGFVTPFEMASCAQAVHSGSQWQTAYSVSEALISTAAQQKCYLVKSFQHAWQQGYPFVQLKCRTNTGNMVVKFSVSAENWMGVAPFAMDAAGAMPFETVPYILPTWWRITRSSSTLKAGSTGSAILFEQDARELQRQGGMHSPLERAVAVSPSPQRSIARLAGHPAVASHNRSLTDRLVQYSGNVKQGAEAAGNMYSAWKSVKPFLSKLLGGFERGASNLGRYAPEVGATLTEVAEDGLPLLMMA